MTTRDDNIVAEEARAIEVGEETGAGAPGASGGSGRGRRDTWATHTGFILACVGSAVGMANIWLFPYRVAQLGGAAFLIPYLIFVALLGFTGVIGEMSFGRAMGAGPMGAFGRAMEMRGVRHGERIGKIIGLVPTLGSLAASRKVPAAYGRQAHNLERRRGREGSRLVQRRLRKENAAGGICLPGVATFDGHPHEQPCASDVSFPHGRIPYREEPCIPSHSETGNSSS